MAQYPHDRLREARERAGYPTAAAFAKTHELTESTYRSHENGSRGLSMAAARLYAELLGVPWTWIMAGEPPASSGEKAGERSAEGSPVPQPAPPPLRPRVDIEVLSAILERVEANLARRRRKMSPLHKAELIANSYALVEEFGLEAATRELRSGLRVRSRSHAKSA
ncbi:MAG: helix-turn-helix transcriptional regulator [Alphaproteobacteria bacterium]